MTQGSLEPYIHYKLAEPQTKGGFTGEFEGRVTESLWETIVLIICLIIVWKLYVEILKQKQVNTNKAKIKKTKL